MSDYKVGRLAKLICDWNAGKWEGKEEKLLSKIWDLFRKEGIEEWRKRIRERRRDRECGRKVKRGCRSRIRLRRGGV